MTESQLLAWLHLYFTPKLGAVKLRRLLSHASPSTLIALSADALRALGLNQLQVSHLHGVIGEKVETSLAWWSRSKSHHIINFTEPPYPFLLQQIASPPPLLFINGAVESLSLPQVSIVGSRHASIEGLKIAQQFASQLVSMGAAVTSGLALGIDGHAHDGALNANGVTLAVLGSGMDNLYPRNHQRLAERIVDFGGALISEFPPKTAPKSVHFPRRNRIVSGLSFALLVIEAAEKSGSLITARYALEQNRDVFAVPGPIYHNGFIGSNRLIQQGAGVILSDLDLIDLLSPLLEKSVIECLKRQAVTNLPLLEQNKLKQDNREQDKPQHASQKLSPQTGSPSVVTTAPFFPISDGEPLPFAKLLANVGNEVTSVDILVQRTHIPVHEVMMQLLELELMGHIIAVSGGYRLNNKAPDNS